MIDKNQILATLKKLGPSSPTAIANSMGAEPSAIGYHLRNLLAAKEVKAAGVSNSRVYALPDQNITGTKKTVRFSGNTREAVRDAVMAAAPMLVSASKRDAPKPQAALFLPAFTEDSRLVIVHDAGHILFTPEQTQSLADLLLNHFEV